MSEQEWDFYFCRVDDGPASIFVNLALIRVDADASTPCLYVAFLPLVEPLVHGMGSAADMERLGPIEDALFDRIAAAGGVPCGRLRNNGVWQICAYGPRGLPFAV